MLVHIYQRRKVGCCHGESEQQALLQAPPVATYGRKWKMNQNHLWSNSSLSFKASYIRADMQSTTLEPGWVLKATTATQVKAPAGSPCCALVSRVCCSGLRDSLTLTSNCLTCSNHQKGTSERFNSESLFALSVQN